MKEAKSETVCLEVSLPAHVHAMLEHAAEIQGRTLTDFVADAAIEAARQTIETEIIRLSVEDQRRFAEIIINPPEPNAALRRAFEAHRELFSTA
jgi:uncharacterized protein (DUF1778 family)